jgi:hypothetical protein
MFFCIDSGTVAENFTIANSRFENDWGYSAAGVTVKNSGCVRNVTIRNSFVRGGYSAGGLVADNHNVKAGLILDSKNENTTVISANIAGGIVGQSDGVLQGVRNSGRVYGRLAGGIVGNASPYYMYGGSSMLVGSAYNTGTVVASGDGAVVGGGIAGYSRSSTLSNVFNTGLVEGSSISGSLSVGGVVGVADSNSTITTIGNWGRVHALNGKQVYAGGLVGRIDGYIYRITNSENFVYITPVAYSFNYGPVTVKSALEESYAGGLIGKGKGFTMQTAYNRGSVKNEANVADAVTGGVIATVDSAIIAQTYAFAETLTGKKVAAVTYEATGFDTFNHVLYNADMGNYPAYNGASADMRDSIVEPLSFEEMMYPSVMQLHPGFKSEKYVDNGCLPVFSYDTTSACAVTVVKDFFGDADEPYKVGYIVDVFYADSTLNPNDSGLTPVLPKPVASLLQVEVSGRNVAVTGLLENRPVMVFDMRGRMVASARFHGTSVNLMIPKSGRYLVRSGKQSRLIVVR